jgi:DNA repair exonuclease SbcCD nuclease subunit/ABC-type lipoprotein export system ATPase subunit
MKKIKIAHLADIHVRPHQYLDEMQFTFDKLFESLFKEKVDLVVICGDFFHSKLTVSSEYFDVAYSFFRKLGDNFPSIVIPGNHDSALTNQGKLDSITPIVSAVNRDAKFPIQYHKQSKSFSLDLCNFIDFHHFSILENKTSWPKAESLDQKKINIALYHGAINNCIVDNGWTSRGNRDDLDVFSGFDFAFLGDIHKAQFLDKEKTIAYPGSLRQNNFGEDLDKGYLLWEISEDGNFKSERVILEQKRYFFTFVVNSVEELMLKISEEDSIPKDCRWRIKSTKTLDITDEILIKEEIIKNYAPQQEIQFLPPEDEPLANTSVKVGNLDILHDNIRDFEVQKQLIEEYFKKKSVEKDVLDQIVSLDKLYHSHVDTDVLRDVIYTPKALKWDNFLSYGKGNVINFDKLNGLIGVFGPNGSGKSSIFDVLFFSLFNSIYREGANKNGDYVNRKCKRSDLTLEIELNQSRFVIDRGIKKTWVEGKEEPKVENLVDFYKLPKSDANSLNGETVPDTNKLIRDVFGTKEDAEMLSHCSQFGLMSFVDAKGTKRKEVLSKFFDLGVFDTKFELASKDYKEIKLKLKDCNKDVLIKSKQEFEKSLKDLESEKQSIESGLEKSRIELEQIEEEILDETKKITKIPKIKEVNLSEVALLETKVSQLESLLSASAKLDISEEEFERLERLEKEVYGNKQKLPILQKQSKLIESIPGVEDCKNCALAKDSYLAEGKSLAILKTISSSEKDLDLLLKVKSHRKQKEEFETFKSQLEIKNRDLEQFKLHEKQYKINEKIEEVIRKLKERKVSIQNSSSAQNASLMKVVSAQASSSTKLQIVEEKLLMEVGLSEKEKIYSLYLDAMSKNGISYWIISKKLTLINKLVNQILSQAVSFKFSLEDNEEEKSLKVYITDTEKGKRPIELASGGEKTLVALSVRAALWKLCLLPKMPILVLDESLVFLDSERYDSAIKLIKYLLSEYFDKIFIITHNEEIKRVVDDSIYINKHKGSSLVEVK